MDAPRWEMIRSIPARFYLINHPNAGGVLVLGLGCENSNIDVLKNYIGDYDPKRVRFLVAQESEDEIADALNILEDLSAYVGSFEREDIDCSELVIGMKCGGFPVSQPTRS